MLCTEFVTLYRAPPYLLGTSRAHVVLLRKGRVGHNAPVAAARFVGQSLDAFLQEPLHPFVDKTATDPTVAAMSLIVIPSARSKIIRPRRARPAEIVVARCHASSVRRSAGVRQIVREVVRPRAIQTPHREEIMEPFHWEARSAPMRNRA